MNTRRALVAGLGAATLAGLAVHRHGRARRRTPRRGARHRVAQRHALYA